jgi:hypothetical protein
MGRWTKAWKRTDIFANGDIYSGQYYKGHPQENGEYIWESGSVYVGQFKNGLKQVGQIKLILTKRILMKATTSMIKSMAMESLNGQEAILTHLLRLRNLNPALSARPLARSNF